MDYLRILDYLDRETESSTESGTSSETIEITYSHNQRYYFHLDPYLSAQSNYNLRITEIAAPVTSSITISDASVEEGNTLAYTIRLSEATTQNVTVTPQINTSGSTASLSDYPGQGFALVTFTPGQTIKTISISTVEDSINENDETVRVDLVNPVNGTISDSRGIGTIRDDDGIYLVEWQQAVSRHNSKVDELVVNNGGVCLPTPARNRLERTGSSGPRRKRHGVGCCGSGRSKSVQYCGSAYWALERCQPATAHTQYD